MRFMRDGNHGFTLIETAVTLGLTGLLLTSTVPALHGMLARRSIAAAAADLALALALARSEASTSGVRTVVAPRDGLRWTSGWRVFSDHNDNGTLDAGEPVLREFGTPDPNIAFDIRFGAGTAGNALSYDEAGFVRRPGSNGLVLGRMVLTNDGGSRVFCFGTARVRSATGAGCS